MHLPSFLMSRHSPWQSCSALPRDFSRFSDSPTAQRKRMTLGTICAVALSSVWSGAICVLLADLFSRPIAIMFGAEGNLADEVVRNMPKYSWAFFGATCHFGGGCKKTRKKNRTALTLLCGNAVLFVIYQIKPKK